VIVEAEIYVLLGASPSLWTQTAEAGFIPGFEPVWEPCRRPGAEAKDPLSTKGRVRYAIGANAGQEF
jgi:hypothetical protein